MSCPTYQLKIGNVLYGYYRADVCLIDYIRSDASEVYRLREKGFVVAYEPYSIEELREEYDRIRSKNNEAV